jgi:hypothetical protein
LVQREVYKVGASQFLFPECVTISMDQIEEKSPKGVLHSGGEAE